MSQDERSQTGLPPLPPRPESGHKGTFGTVVVIGGQCADARFMLGGPALTGMAALRSGCGLVTLALPAPLVAHGLTILPEATGVALPVDAANNLRASECAAILDDHAPGAACVVIGPGLGTSDAASQIVVRLIGQEDAPVVVDADALNCLAALRDFSADLRAQCILTPHPGEFKRLAEALGMSVDLESDDGRTDAARDLAARLGCVVVLKGHRTVVSSGVTSWTNDGGNPALGTGGTGDVLAGIIAGFIAQYAASGLLDLYDCARLAVHVGSRAADIWANERDIQQGMLASELPDVLVDAIAAYRRSRSD